MGVEAAIIGSTLAAGLFSYAMTPKSSVDATNYQLLAQTQAAANEETDAAKARIEAARKREELRQQSLYSSQIMTSDAGTDDTDLSVKETVLGRGR